MGSYCRQHVLPTSNFTKRHVGDKEYLMSIEDPFYVLDH